MGIDEGGKEEEFSYFISQTYSQLFGENKGFHFKNYNLIQF